MKRSLPFLSLFGILAFAACSHRYYAPSYFDQQTANHKIIAVMPAEMVFTGKQPEGITPDDITKIEETESRSFQQALYNSILRHAESKKYFTRVSVQDLSTTQRLLEQNHIGYKEACRKDDKELTKLLGVDAIVRLRVQKQRYMSDAASYGISLGKQIIYNTGLGSKVPIPYVSEKTNDIYASCDIVSDNRTLWNDNYKSASDWNSPANQVIENITNVFGAHFPYKQRK